MQNDFYNLVEKLTAELSGEEVLLANLAGEQSDFARLNTSQIRQAGSVTQQYLSLELIDGQKHIEQSLTLTGQADDDLAAARAVLDQLRDALPACPDDPYLLYATDPQDTTQQDDTALPPLQDALDDVLAIAAGRDLVGLLAAGQITRGFANSLGQRNWYQTRSFHLEWCFYSQADKAVKSHYAGRHWSRDELVARVDTALQQLDILNHPPRTIEPGEYRVYLAPSALGEVLEMMSYTAFGIKARRTHNSCLLSLLQADRSLNPALTLRDNTADGLAANFTDKGYIKPPAVTLIDAGQIADTLVSPRSGKEFHCPPNCSQEYPESLDLAGGDLSAEKVCSTLAEGVYCNALWYLNYSDMPAGRITGMTRFATFWVEGGQIVAPLNVMRFDDTLERMLGENLLALTTQREFLPSSETYGQRSTASVHLPGAIIDDFRFTL